MRSAFAEAVFRQQLAAAGLEDAAVVASAGVRAAVGMHAEENAARVARTMGVPLDSHRAQPTTAALLAQYEEVYLMDDLNHRLLTGDLPQYRDRIHYLSEKDPQPGQREIGDPYLEGDRTIRTTFERIERCTAAIVAELQRGSLAK